MLHSIDYITVPQSKPLSHIGFNMVASISLYNALLTLSTQKPCILANAMNTGNIPSLNLAYLNHGAWEVRSKL